MTPEANSKTARPPAAGYGCTLAGFLLLASTYAAFRRPAVGIPLATVAALIAWLVARRASAARTAIDDRRRALGPPVGDVWRRLFELEGIGDVIEDVAPHVRQALRLSTRPVDGLAIGSSRIGGTPDLAHGMTWPRRNGVPLSFLAQFDLREVAQAVGASPLPKTGRLWFFYDVKSWPSGSDPSDAGGAVVLYDPGGTPLESTVAPADLPRRARFRLCALTMEAYEAIPDIGNEPWLEKRLADDARCEAYDEIASYLTSGWSIDAHTLLGFASPVQDVMELECQLVTNGITFETRKKEAARVKELEPGARDWRLLLQIESDGKADMMWGDAGCLYFWIREEDLRVARFDRTWTMFQCH